MIYKRLNAESFSYDREHECWVCKNVPYVKKPLAPRLQCLNIYIPGAYIDGSGKIVENGKCGIFDSQTAPFIFENGIGGYSESEPLEIESPMGHGMEMLSMGAIFVSPGARGHQTKSCEKYIGKSPAALIDLKSAVRFIRSSREDIPGDTERIISVGVSAGGALSSLLGSTGNSPLYKKMLKEAGAEDGRDDIFAAQCYCPIIDLDHADLAYEWMFKGIHDYSGMNPMTGGTLTPFQCALSECLCDKYIAYFNSLGLRNPANGELLSFGKDGRSGTAYEYLLSKLEESAEKYFKLLNEKRLPIRTSAENYISGKYTYSMVLHGPHGDKKKEEKQPEPVEKIVQGTDKREWLSYMDGKAAITGLDGMWKGYLSRLKNCPAFDDMNLLQAENSEFGNETTERRHFDTFVAECLQELIADYPEECKKALDNGYADISGNPELAAQKKLLNPFCFIGTGEQADCAEHWRIRVGSHDPHTSFTMTMTLALKLMSSGCKDVDYAIVWDQNHGKADFPGELSDWIVRLCG